MMLWDETPKKQEYVVPENVVDVSYRLSCKMVPTTHAWALREALYSALPWLEAEADTAIHQIHGATTGNGWERPPDGELIHLSKRSRMTLRVPAARVEDARQLVGQALDIDGHVIEVGEASVKTLVPLATIFSRYVIVPDGYDESQFVDWVVSEVRAKNINIRKMLCGKSNVVSTPEADYETRSVMIADLEKPDSVSLQETGIGPGRHLGCGIFMPHKGIKAVGETEDKEHFSGT